LGILNFFREYLSVWYDTFGAAGATTVSVLATTGASAVGCNSWCKVFDIAFTILPFSPVPLT
jgi:hypothetical protein